jgi:hypothetical protein
VLSWGIESKMASNDVRISASTWKENSYFRKFERLEGNKKESFFEGNPENLKEIRKLK